MNNKNKKILVSKLPKCCDVCKYSTFLEYSFGELHCTVLNNSSVSATKHSRDVRCPLKLSKA